MTITNLTDEEQSQVIRFLAAIAPNAVVEGQDKKKRAIATGGLSKAIELIQAYSDKHPKAARAKVVDLYVHKHYSTGDEARIFAPISKDAISDCIEIVSNVEYCGKLWPKLELARFHKL